MILADPAMTFRHAEIVTAPAISSKTLWPDFELSYVQLPVRELSPEMLSDHRLLINLGAPIQLLWRSKHSLAKSYCLTGNMVNLASPAETTEIGWEDELNALCLAVKPDFIEKLVELENFKFTAHYNIEDIFLREIAFKIYGEMSAGNFIEKIYLESLIIATLLHLTIEYRVAHKKLFAPKGKLSASQLKKVIDYAHEFVHANISLAELAATVHLSPFHFSRLFRHTTGLSPYQYVLQLKIDYAKKLMRNKTDSLSEVAYTLNFTDQAHFSNVFKKFTGVCPRKFMSNFAA